MNVLNWDSVMLIWLDKCGWYFGLPVDCLVSLRTCLKCQKLVALNLLVWHLVARDEPLGNGGQVEATRIAWCLAIRVESSVLFGLCFSCLWCWDWTRRCLSVSWAGRFMDGGEHMIIWAGRFILWCSRVRIRAGKFICSVLTLEDCYERGGS